MKNKQYLYKTVCSFFFFAFHSSCLAAVWVESLWHTTGMCSVSRSRHPFDISTASQLLGAESRQMSASLLSHKGKEAVKKKNASSIIYLITVSIRQSSRAQSPRGFCEALWNRLACKHAFKTSADKEGFMSLACLLLNHTPAGICTFKVLQSAFTREPRSSCISLNEIGEKVNEISEPGSKKTYVPFRDSYLDCARP